MATPLERKLFQAAKKGDAKAVRQLLDGGVDVGARDGNGWTALHEACRWGREEAVATLLAAGADANAAHPDLGYTPLFVATFDTGHAAIVRRLLDAGAAPSLADAHGFTPLHNAARAGDLDALTLLLDAGGDPSLRAGTGQQAAVDVAPPEQAAAVRDRIASRARSPRQSQSDAAAAAARSRRAAPEPAEVEAAPLASDKIRVVGEAAPIGAAAVEALRRSVGALPSGYAEFVGSFGAGTLQRTVRVYAPDAILRDRDEWRARVAAHWFWGDGPLLTRLSAQKAVRIADTLDGDELVYQLEAPEELLLLPRERTTVERVSRQGLLPALTRLLTSDGKKPPRRVDFEPLDAPPGGGPRTAAGRPRRRR